MGGVGGVADGVEATFDVVWVAENVGVDGVVGVGVGAAGAAVRD